MKKLNFLFVVLFVSSLILACNEGSDSYTGSNMEDSLASVRVEAAPPMRVATVSSTNLALKGHAFAQSTFKYYSPDRINDGSTNTTVGPNNSWANAYKYAPDGYLPQWVDLRFDSTVTFSLLRLYTSYNYEMQDWTMLVFDSATLTWDTLGKVRQNISTMRYFNYKTPVSADIVRILCENGAYRQAGYARINELELF